MEAFIGATVLLGGQNVSVSTSNMLDVIAVTISL